MAADKQSADEDFLSLVEPVVSWELLRSVSEEPPPDEPEPPAATAVAEPEPPTATAVPRQPSKTPQVPSADNCAAAVSPPAGLKRVGVVSAPTAGAARFVTHITENVPDTSVVLVNTTSPPSSSLVDAFVYLWEDPLEVAVELGSAGGVLEEVAKNDMFGLEARHAAWNKKQVRPLLSVRAGALNKKGPSEVLWRFLGVIPASEPDPAGFAVGHASVQRQPRATRLALARTYGMLRAAMRGLPDACVFDAG